MPSRNLRMFVVSFLAFGLITVVWAFPLVSHANSRFLGNTASDGSSTVRDYWSIEHQGGNPFTMRHDPLIDAPQGLDIAPGTEIANAVQPAFIWGVKDIVGLVTAWNLFILLGIALTGAMTFTLLTSLGLRTIAAAFGAYAFTFGGYVVDNAYAGHGGLVQAWVFPLLLLALLRANERESLLPAAVAGLACGLAFYVHTYSGAFGLMMVVLFFAYTAVRKRRVESPRVSLSRLGAALGALVLSLLPALIAIHHFRSAAQGSGAHTIASLQRYGARIAAYVAPSAWSPLGHLVPTDWKTRLALTQQPSLFFGYTTLVLATGWLVWIRRRADVSERERLTTWFAAALVVAAFLFSLPRHFAVGPLDLPAPSWFTGHITTVLRVYARFGVLVGLGLAVLAAFALDRIERLRGRRWALALLLLLVLELTPTAPAKTWNVSVPPASDQWLARHPGGEVAIYPLTVDQPAAATLNYQEYYFQRFHAHPLFWTGSSFLGKQATALRIISQSFSSPWTPHVLAAEQVKYVVLRTDVYREIGEGVPVLDPKSFRLLASVRDARIYRLLAAPIDLAAFFREHGAQLASAAGQPPPTDSFGPGFYAAEKFKYNVPWCWLQQDGKVSIRPTGDPTTMEVHALAFSNGPARTLQVYGPGGRLLGSATITSSLAPITIGPFPIGLGKSTFTFHVTPGPEVLGPTDPRVASVYLSQPAFQPILKLHG